MMVELRPLCRVLIVDDAPSVCEALRLVIEGEEDMVVVGEAGNGREALRLAAIIQPDIIILDYWLPDSTGTELIVSLREIVPVALIVILTVESGVQFRRAALACGAAAYILKTTPTSDLFDTLRSLRTG